MKETTNKQTNQIIINNGKNSTNSNNKSYNNLSEYLRDLYNNTALGIQYWYKHKTHKCYNCGKYGHIAQDCHKVCPMCLNIHNHTVCVHSLTKFYKKIEEILKKNVVLDEERLIKKVEKARAELERSDTEAIINECKKKMDYNRTNECQHYWTISYKAGVQNAIRFNTTILKPNVVERLEVKASCNNLSNESINEFKLAFNDDDNEIQLIKQPPLSKSLDIRPPTTYIFEYFNEEVNRKRIYAKYKPIIDAKELQATKYKDKIEELKKVNDEYNLKLDELREKCFLYEQDELIKKGLIKKEFNLKQGWFYNPAKCAIDISNQMAIIKKTIEANKFKIEMNQSYIDQVDGEKIVLLNARNQEAKRILKPSLLQQSKGVFSLHHGNDITINRNNPYKNQLAQIGKYQVQLNKYLEDLNQIRSSMQQMRITQDSLNSANRELFWKNQQVQHARNQLESIKNSKDLIYHNIREKADEKIRRQYKKLHNKQQEFYDMKREHYKNMRAQQAVARNKLRNMGDIVRSYQQGNNNKKRAVKHTGSVTINYTNGQSCYFPSYTKNAYQKLKEKISNNPKVASVNYSD